MDPPSSQTNLNHNYVLHKPQLPPGVTAAFARHQHQHQHQQLQHPASLSNSQSQSQNSFTPSAESGTGSTSGYAQQESNTTNTNTNTNTNTKKSGKSLPHNVDICITCVTDKPPQLPLREELPSLGIEVVYNAQGVGTKASKHEAKKMMQKFRHDEQYKDMKKRRLFAPSHQTVVSQLQDRKRQEDALEIPRGVSYEKYEKILSSSNSNIGGDNDSTTSDLGSNSVSTSHTNGAESFASSLGEKRKPDKFGIHHKKKKRIVGTTSANANANANANQNANKKGLFQGGLPLKFSFQNSRDQAQDDHESISSQTSYTPGPIHPSSPFYGATQTASASPNNYRYNQFSPNNNSLNHMMMSPSTPSQHPQHLRTTTNKPHQDSSPSSGGFSASQPQQQYMGPPTPNGNTSPFSSPNSSAAAGSLTQNTGSTTNGLFKTVFQAFSGDSSQNNKQQRQYQQYQSLHPLEEERRREEELSMSESQSVSKSQSTSSDVYQSGSRSGGEDDGDNDRPVQRYRGPSPPKTRRPPPVDTDLIHDAIHGKSNNNVAAGANATSPKSTGTNHSHEPHFHDIRPNPTRSPKSSGGGGDHHSSDPSNSQDVSRDPSSISTNFTKPNPNQPNPVQVVASNDPNVKKFLPGLQTVPSESSSTTTSDSNNNNKDQHAREKHDENHGQATLEQRRADEETNNNIISSNNRRPYRNNHKQPQEPPQQRLHHHRSSSPYPLSPQPKSTKDPPVLPPKDPPLAAAFAAFNNFSSNDEIYETLGPVAAAAAASNHHYQQQGNSSKRQRRVAPDPPHSPTREEQMAKQKQQQEPSGSTDSTTASPTWMNSAKTALENVAAEVYKQATRTSNSPLHSQHHGMGAAASPQRYHGSPNRASPADNIFFGGDGGGGNNAPTAADKTDNQNKNRQGKHNQQQPLSPTSTLSSNTANQQQQQQIQIHGHKPFLFPSADTKNDANKQFPPNSKNYSSNAAASAYNPFPHHPHVEIHVRSDGTQVIVSSSIGTKSVTAFYEALQQPKTPVDSIQRMLRVCPGLVKVRLQQQSHNAAQRGRLGLHTACARGFPHHRITNASSTTSTGLALELVDDIQQLKRLISVLVEANRGACTVLDDHGDLPAHLLARTLMEWEAQWYEKVYEKVQKDQDTDGRNAAAITKLYQSMSQCIEIVLHPVAAFCNANNNNAAGSSGNAATTICRAPGSVGLLLPLHIASIFTASVPTLRQLLEQDPTAATVPCNLGHLRTFIPDHSLPLELHDKLSTDFPKWEIGAEARKSKPIHVAGGGSLIVEDYMRRSDLLFAFHPTVPRFRMEATRIERLEAKVISESNQMDQKFRDKGEHGHLSVAVKRIWIWLCTFQDINDHFQATYYPSVKRILDSIPASTIPYLASVKTTQGKPLSRVAAPECQALLRTRLEEYESSQASRLEQMVAQAVATAAVSPSGKSSVAGSQDDTTTTNATAYLSLKGKGYVGVLCRTLFHIHEDSMPTSFILLPYKLTKNDQGKLGIDKQSSAATAVKFAECLLQLTDPKNILNFLEQKSMQSGEHRISSELDDDTSTATKKRCQEAEEALIDLYEPGKAYLYLIDELIGLPIVPVSGTSLYPIELTQPSNIVRKLLPLMLTGMILMRGEKALSVLVNVLLDKSVRYVSPNWVDAAREITAYLYSQQDSRSDNSLPGLDALIEELRAFVSNNSSVKSSNDRHENTEWAIELSILRMVVSMNDNRRSFAGLKAKRDEPGTVLWTKHKIEEEIRNDTKSEAESSKKKPDASVTYFHEDPPGMFVRAAESTSSSKASTKKSSNQTNDDNVSAAASSAKTTPSHATASSGPEIVSPVSPLTESLGTGSLETPKTREDSSADNIDNIEKLRMQSTLSTPDSKWLAAEAQAEADAENDASKEDVSIEEADSGFDGEELAGVRILLEAEEGPSLLDQESTTEEEGTDSESNFVDRYKSLFERTNDSGSDSVHKKGTAPIEIAPSDSGDEETQKKQSGGKSKLTNKDGNRPNTPPKAVSSDSGDATVADKDVYVEATSSSHSGEPMILPAKETKNGGKRWGEHSKSSGKHVFLDLTDSSGSDEQATMSASSQTTKVSIRNQTSREQESEESRSESPSNDDTNESKSLASKSIGTNESKSVARYNSSESDDDDDAVLKFDFVSDARSQSSKSVPSAMERSTDRLYDESRIEVIDHHSVNSDGNSVFSTGRVFENETLRLHDYALQQLTTNHSTSAPPSPPSSPAPSPPNEDISSPVSFPSEPSKTSTGKQSSTWRGNHSHHSQDETLQQLNTAATFAELQPASPIMSSPSLSILKNSKTPPTSRSNPSTPKLSTRSSNATTSTPHKVSSPIDQANVMLENLVKDTQDKLWLSTTPQTPTSILRYGRENFVMKDVTFMDMREQLTDQALKVDCLESTLESIRIREDKLLSRGEMLQDFLSDLLDQSENMNMDTEKEAKKVERRLGRLEERLLCNEIETQHLSLRVYAVEEETEAIAEEDYNRALSEIYEEQVKQQQRIERQEQREQGVDAILGRTATVERRRSPGRQSPSLLSASRRSSSSRRGRRLVVDDSDLSSLDAGHDGSLLVLDGYSSNPDVENNTSEFAVDGYSRQQSRKSRNSRYSRDDQSVPYESTRPQPKPHKKSYNHHPHRRRPRPRRDYDMNQLLRNASLDERSIEYEMGLAMFGTLDHSSSAESQMSHTHHHSSHVHINISSTTTASGTSPSHPIRCNSLDAYEHMRDEYRMGLGVSSFHQQHSGVGIVGGVGSDDAASHQSYSSAGEYTAMDMHSLEGDGLDWVKMSARQFEVQQTYRQ